MDYLGSRLAISFWQRLMRVLRVKDHKRSLAESGSQSIKGSGACGSCILSTGLGRVSLMEGNNLDLETGQ